MAQHGDALRCVVLCCDALHCDEMRSLLYHLVLPFLALFCLVFVLPCLGSVVLYVVTMIACFSYCWIAFNIHSLISFMSKYIAALCYRYLVVAVAVVLWLLIWLLFVLLHSLLDASHLPCFL